MNRSERWNSEREIRRRFEETADMRYGAGPVLYCRNGKKCSDSSEANIGVFGRPGMGKSQCSSLPFMREVLEKGESLIMMDPKGEAWRRNACFIPGYYQVFCVNLRDPANSLTCWNPISMPYRQFKSGQEDAASALVSELWSGVYPKVDHNDKFWPSAAANYAKGLTYSLFEMGNEDCVNLASIAAMMQQSEARFGPGTLTKALYELMPGDSLAHGCLAPYVMAPMETRASIHSVAFEGLEAFNRSKGLMKMLASDTLNIMDIDVNRPFALIIITPDETGAYDTLAGLLVSQMTQYLTSVAEEMGGRLPIRVNVILEELGSVGRSIPNLPKLMSAGRSRNIRLMLVLQSMAQLDDVYGKSSAITIRDCIGITVGFSTNSWDTLTEWSQRCGERQVESGGRMVKEPLITASQLAAMPAGTALVLVGGGCKFITHLPMYDQMYDNSSWKAPDRLYRPVAKQAPLEVLDLQKFVKEKKRIEMEAALKNITPPVGAPKITPLNMDDDDDDDDDWMDNEPLIPSSPLGPPVRLFPREKSMPGGLLGGIDLDKMIADIDARIAELEAEEKREAEEAKRKAEEAGKTKEEENEE